MPPEGTSGFAPSTDNANADRTDPGNKAPSIDDANARTAGCAAAGKATGSGPTSTLLLLPLASLLPQSLILVPTQVILSC